MKVYLVWEIEFYDTYNVIMVTNSEHEAQIVADTTFPGLLDEDSNRWYEVRTIGEQTDLHDFFQAEK